MLVHLLAHDASIQKTARLLILHFVAVAHFMVVFPGGKPVPTFPETLVVRDAPALGTVFLIAARQEEKLSVTKK